MVDQLSLLAKKDILYRLIPLVFTTLFFLMIAPIQQLQFIRNADPVLTFSGTLLLIVGLIFIIEFFRNLPDAKSHAGAKSGALLFLVMGIITMIFGVLAISELYDPFTNAGVENAENLLLTALLGLSSLILFVAIVPLLHGKKSLAHAIRTG